MRIGIGYIFGARDNGVRRTIDDLNSGLEDTRDTTEAATSWADKLRNAYLAFSAVQLNRISGDLDDIQNRLQGVTGSGVDTRMEQMFTQFDQGFAKTAAMAGKSGAELRAFESQVFSTAFALNRSADEVGANILAIEKAKLSVEDIAGAGGTLSDVQKMLEVTGYSGEQFASVFQDLNKSWSFGEQGTRDFLDRFASVNMQLGQGQEAFEALPGILQKVSSDMAHLDLSPDEVESMAMGISKLGASLVGVVGDSPREAMDKASEMFSALAAESNAFDKLAVGMGGDIGSLTGEFAHLGGGLGDSLQAMRDGARDPAAFMGAVAETFAKLDANGSEAAQVMKTRLRMSLAQINPSFTFLANGGDAAVEAIGAIAATAPQAGQGLLQTANDAYRSGLTLEESMDRARMSMEQAFGGASREERVAFARAMRKSYGLVGETVRNLTGDSEKYAESWREQAAGMGMSANTADKLRGVLGPLVEYMATFASTGVHGVMIKIFGEDSALAGGIGVIAAGIGQLLPMIGPLLLALPALTPIFAGLGTAISGAAAAIGPFIGPVLAAAAAIGVLYLAFTGKLPAAINYVAAEAQKAFVFVANIGTTLLNKVSSFFSSLNGKKMAKDLIVAVRKSFSALFAYIAGPGVALNPAVPGAAQGLMAAFVGALTAGGKFVSDFASTLFNVTVRAIHSVNFQKVATTMTSALGNAFQTALAKRKMVYSSLVSAIQGTDWRALGLRFSKALMSIRHRVAGALLKVMKDAQDFMANVDWAEVGLKVGEAIGDGLIMAGDLLLKAVVGLVDLLIGAFDMVSKKQFWVDTFEVIVEGLYTVFQGMGSLVTFIQGVFGGIATSIVDALFGPGVAQLYRDTFKRQIDMVTGLFSDFFDAVRDMAYALFGNSINSFVEHDFAIIETILDTASGWFYALKDIAGSVFESAVGFITKMFDKFKLVGTLIKGIADRFGFTVADVQEITAESAAASGGSTQAAAAAVVGSSNSDLIREVVKQHNEDRVYLKKIVELLGSGSRPTAPAMPAAPTSTGGP